MQRSQQWPRSRYRKKHVMTSTRDQSIDTDTCATAGLQGRFIHCLRPIWTFLLFLIDLPNTGRRNVCAGPSQIVTNARNPVEINVRDDALCTCGKSHFTLPTRGSHQNYRQICPQIWNSAQGTSRLDIDGWCPFVSIEKSDISHYLKNNLWMYWILKNDTRVMKMPISWLPCLGFNFLLT